MTHRAIPLIALPRVRTIYLVSLAQVCVVYVVEEVASFRGLMGVVRNTTRSLARRKK